jgi:hypothetical protein
VVEKLLITLGFVVLLGICGIIVHHQVTRPLDEKLAWVDRELANINPTWVEFPQPDWNFKRWHEAITGKKALWQEIVPPPPPPPPKEEPPPDLRKELTGVEATRSQIGQKVKFKTPENQKGVFYTVGDKINGLTIKSITKDYVEFSLQWKGEELTTRLGRR